MIDSIEFCMMRLELHSSHVIEKRSKSQELERYVVLLLYTKLQQFMSLIKNIMRCMKKKTVL